ncbi:MAG TPA: hypothetical protein VMB74_07690 [Streptosporangiaceae bacterium]|nr:hypothetical protein [Streptosporangiaceae bacterium]
MVNNAGIGEGGSTVDIPAANIRHEFEVNVTGPLLLTQGWFTSSLASRPILVARCARR